MDINSLSFDLLSDSNVLSNEIELDENELTFVLIWESDVIIQNFNLTFRKLFFDNAE